MKDKKNIFSEESKKVQSVQFSAFPADSHSAHELHQMDLVSDIPVQVSVELGRAKKRVRELLELEPGSILVIDKVAGEPVDVLVNNKRIAIGEVVVMDDNFSVRITDIISQRDRMKKMR